MPPWSTSLPRTVLMQRPRLILADEPTASLDPLAAAEICSLLAHAADDELSNKPVARPQLVGMQNTHAELLKQQRILAQQQTDRTELDAELADAVQRYRALKSVQAGTAETPAAPASAPTP